MIVSVIRNELSCLLIAMLRRGGDHFTQYILIDWDVIQSHFNPMGFVEI